LQHLVGDRHVGRSAHHRALAVAQQQQRAIVVEQPGIVVIDGLAIEPAFGVVGLALIVEVLHRLVVDALLPVLAGVEDIGDAQRPHAPEVPIDGVFRAPAVAKIALVVLEDPDADQPVIESVNFVVAHERRVPARLGIELQAGRGKQAFRQVQPLR
jgi:hypothetical protein